MSHYFPQCQSCADQGIRNFGKGNNMANSQEIIQASSDSDLLERALVLGLSLGISEQGIRDAFKRIVAGEVGEEGNTTSVATAYASAQETYENAVKNLPPTPGKNLAGVTDEILIEAIQKHSYVVVP